MPADAAKPTEGEPETRRDPPHDTVMWEVGAAPTRLADLVAWVEAEAVPELLRRDGCLEVAVFDSADDRAVVIAQFAGDPGQLPDPPADLLRRPPQTWPFRHLSSHRPAGR